MKVMFAKYYENKHNPTFENIITTSEKRVFSIGDVLEIEPFHGYDGRLLLDTKSYLTLTTKQVLFPVHYTKLAKVLFPEGVEKEGLFWIPYTEGILLV